MEEKVKTWVSHDKYEKKINSRRIKVNEKTTIHNIKDNNEEIYV